MIFDKLVRMILPPDDRKFLDIYFVKQAGLTHEAAELFHEIVVKAEHMNEAYYLKAQSIKHKSGDLTHETVDALNQTFITPIERQDILEITLLLNKITKRILRSAVNFRVCRIDKFPESMRLQAEVLVAGTNEVKTCIDQLRQLRKSHTLNESHKRMIDIERRGDEIFAKAIEDLFSGSFDALDVIKFRGIYRDIESAMDGCYSVSETALNVAVKNN
ncbi:MAG: DUF47 family protein [Bdellovibrionota bacterium]